MVEKNKPANRLTAFTSIAGVSNVPRGSVTIALREFELDRSYMPNQETTLDHGVVSNQQHSGKFLYIEIESCSNLPMGAQAFNQIPDAFIVVKLGGMEIARTKAIYNTNNPNWHDECYEIPAMVYKDSDGKTNKTIQIEVWQMNTFSVGDQLGMAEFETDPSLMNSMAITTYTKELKIDERLEKPVLSGKGVKGKGGGKLDESKDDGLLNEDGSASLPDHSAGKKQWSKVRGHIISAGSHSDFKIPNPNPTRRISSDDKMKYTDVKKSSRTVVIALCIIVCYLLLGVVSFSFIFEPSWSVRESLYFSVVTFTTVGYGDLYPTTKGGQVWSCFFALIGIGIIGYALSIISQNIVQMSLEAKGNESKKKETADDIYEESDSEEVKQAKLAKHAETTAKTDEEERRARRDKVVMRVVKSLLPICVTVVFGAVVVKNLEETAKTDEAGEVMYEHDGSPVMRGWTWTESFYWCVITGASVGYGEFSLKSKEGQSFGIVFIPMSVGVIGAALTKIANIYVEKEIEKANAKLLGRELTMEDLENMNTDDDGEVSELEFIEFMLKTMNKVDQALLDDLHASFRKMDADGSGSLQKEDLELLAKKKLDLSRQLKLAAYRNSLQKTERGGGGKVGSSSSNVGVSG